MADPKEPSGSRSDAAKPPPTGPAADLADVWDALDALPRAKAGVDLAATTIQLVAAKLAGGTSARDPEPPWLVAWAFRLVIVAAALAAGWAVGRVTAPDQELHNLPLIEHLDLLQEAGSVAFLEVLTERMQAGDGQPQRWFRLMRDPQLLRSEARDFDEALERLRADVAAGDAPASLTRRQARVEQLPPAERDAIERSAETFAGLSRRGREDLETVAQRLADPTQGRLRDAARLWHVIVAGTPPLFRQDVIDMTPERRLEWLQRPAGSEWRSGLAGRGREDLRGADRRPPGPPERLSPDGPLPAEGLLRPDDRRRPGPPRPWQDRPGGDRPPPRFTPGPPPAADRPGVPAETPAPPR
ncbi:MAG: hypothetical protein FJ284_00495 [Planctomycetes bacterium]|nr:hypothetical protein [Planctomycetota bacterium]